MIEDETLKHAVVQIEVNMNKSLEFSCFKVEKMNYDLLELTNHVVRFNFKV